MKHSTQDPKYDIENNQLINSDTGNPIPKDEPVFIFRAKDKHLLAILEAYLMKCDNKEHLAAIEQRIIEIKDWQNKNTHKIKEPDTAQQ